MRLTIYRNTRVFLIRASLTIDVVNDVNTESSRFHTSSAKFASNSNKRCCFLFNEQNREINKKIEIFLIVWFRNVKRWQRRNNVKMLSFDVIQILFRRKNLFILSFFFALRFEIAISFDKMINEKSNTIATKAIFFSITFSARKIFWVVFSAEALRKEVSRSKMIEKMITKNEKKTSKRWVKDTYKNSKERKKAKK